MKVESTQLHQAKARCETCWKELGRETGIITQAKIDVIMYLAERHERLHKTHQTEVLIYEKAPETIDIEESEKKD